MAAHLSLMGYPVALYNRTHSNITQIIARKGIDLKSSIEGLQGFAELSLITSNIKEALCGSEIIMVVVTSTGLADVARSIAPHLQDGQIIILHPGRTLGAVEFAKALEANQCTADVTIAEAETLIYISRYDGPTSVRILRVKSAVPLAAFPASRTASVLKAVESYFPQFVDGINVLQTGLNNMGAVFPSRADGARRRLDRGNQGWLRILH